MAGWLIAADRETVQREEESGQRVVESGSGRWHESGGLHHSAEDSGVTEQSSSGRMERLQERALQTGIRVRFDGTGPLVEPNNNSGNNIAEERESSSK